MHYRDELPDDCPPLQASEIDRPRTFYRMVRNNPPTEADFRSQRQERPTIVLRNVSECHARGVSLFSAERDVEYWLRKERFAGYSSAAVLLDAGMGSLMKSGSRSHFTWWPIAGLDYARLCRVGEE